VVVNEDQLSLAIGKRGQNVRLAARLTGWDVDILTPAEFQAGVARLDQTLKAIDGFPPEAVDKVIALGLIDVRDIEEVGVGPLVEELELAEELAQRVVARCAEDAKVWSAEQAAKKEADASAKAAAASESKRALDALLGIGESGNAPEGETAESSETSMPGPLEASEGGSPEVTVHQQSMHGDQDELSPEERAVRGLAAGDVKAKELEDENAEAAALAEGRGVPPAEEESR
jgi:N utilization substance protein A